MPEAWKVGRHDAMALRQIGDVGRPVPPVPAEAVEQYERRARPLVDEADGAFVELDFLLGHAASFARSQ